MSWKIQVLTDVFSAENVKSAGNMVTTFRQWLDNGKSHISFGRDGLLDRPNSAKDVALSRVHLLDEDDIKKYAATGAGPFRRTSDTYLVYAVNPEDPKHYFLLVVIKPSAHKTMNNTNFVITLIELAKKQFGIKW